jgi:ABC-type transport system involved in multi-copper enzyme maturation permease subunit
MPIFDQGYQHWKGELAGHAWRWLAITGQGVRTGMKNRWLRILVIFSWLPAIVLTFLLALWGMVEQKSEMVMGLAEGVFRMLPFLNPAMLLDPQPYRSTVWTLLFSLFLSVELLFSMVAVLLIGPSLISQDLRFNAIPLYLSRPVRRIDYFFGKLGVIGYFLSMTIIAPSLLAWFCGLLFSLDITLIRDTYLILLSAVGFGLLVVFSAGLLILALSSLSRRSLYVGIAWLAIWFIGGITGSALEGASQSERAMRHYRYQNQKMAQTNRPPNAPGQMAGPGQGPVPQRGHGPGGPAGPGMFPPAGQDPGEQELLDEEIAYARKDWRPLFSYTANLSRVGKVLLDTDTAWKKLADFMPPGPQREYFLLENLGYQYPWYWSGGILAGLMGISVCILNFRVKSLDRLR